MMVYNELPAYINLANSGGLRSRVEAANAILEECTLCPRQCRVNRLSGEIGFCQTGSRAWVSSYGPHFGEESPLVGSGGSGTIFFTHCNLRCNFCQNYDISHQGQGEPVSVDPLARLMLALQKNGCHNINFVTPSHVVPQILSAVEIAVTEGLDIPLVYNTSAYDSVETLKLLDDVFDIYMPDFKFWDPKVSEATCGVTNYPEKARAAIVEMHGQVGDLMLDDEGIATRGLLIRHLVMPAGLSGTRDIMRFIFRKVSPNTYVNIMPQYRPCGTAREIDALAAPLSPADFKAALKDAEKEGITRLDGRRRRFFVR